MSFWQSFQGILGPHGFKGFKAEDMFDKKRWEFQNQAPQNPMTMGEGAIPSGTFNYMPRGGIPSRPGASIASTKQPSRRPPTRKLPVQGRTTALRNTPQLYGVPIPLNKIRGVVEETGRYWNPKLENLARTTGDYWGPKVDRVMDETAQFGRGVADDTFGFWDPMVRRDLGKLEEAWNRADLVGDTKKYWTPKVEQVWSDTIRAYQPKWEDLLKYLRRDD